MPKGWLVKAKSSQDDFPWPSQAGGGSPKTDRKGNIGSVDDLQTGVVTFHPVFSSVKYELIPSLVQHSDTKTEPGSLHSISTWRSLILWMGEQCMRSKLTKSNNSRGDTQDMMPDEESGMDINNAVQDKGCEIVL